MTDRPPLQGSKRKGRLGGRTHPLTPSSISYENRPTPMHDTEAPVVILKPVEGLVARMPSTTL